MLELIGGEGCYVEVYWWRGMLCDTSVAVDWCSDQWRSKGLK